MKFLLLLLPLMIFACNSTTTPEATQSAAATSDCTSADHPDHAHAADCGHEATEHDGHTDYNHDGEKHAVDGSESH